MSQHTDAMDMRERAAGPHLQIEDCPRGVLEQPELVPEGGISGKLPTSPAAMEARIRNLYELGCSLNLALGMERMCSPGELHQERLAALEPEVAKVGDMMEATIAANADLGNVIRDGSWPITPLPLKSGFIAEHHFPVIINQDPSRIILLWSALVATSVTRWAMMVDC